MAHEGPSSQESFESLHGKALAIAQSMSQRWGDLPKETSHVWQAENPGFASVYELNSSEKGGKTGIQRFFENRTSAIERESDKHTKDVLVRRLIIELQNYQTEMNTILSEYKP